MAAGQCELCLVFAHGASEDMSRARRDLEASKFYVEETQAGKHATLKITAPFEELCFAAQSEGLAKPVLSRNLEDCWHFIGGVGPGGQPTHTCLAEFVQARAENFAGFSHPETFFQPWERLLLVWRLLHRIGASMPGSSSAVRPVYLGEPLLHALRRSSSLEEVVPLVWDQAPSKKNPLSRDGIEEMCQAYGPSVAMYFVFMQTFTWWLIPPGLVGFCMWLLRPSDVTVDDSKAIPIFSLGMVLWAAAFPPLIQRAESSFACQWGCIDAEKKEVIRPEFHGQRVHNVVTGQSELAYPEWKRGLKYLASAAVTLVMLGIAFFAMVCSLNLQGYVHHPGEADAEGLETRASPLHIAALAELAEPGRILDPTGAGDPLLGGWITMLPVVLHVIVISLLNTLYRKVAEGLTEWENHQTNTQHENALVLKRFFFEAFDAYVALFYVGFYMRDAVRLRQELVSLYMVDSVRRAGMETLLPWCQQRARRASEGRRRAARKKLDEADLDGADVAVREALDRAEYEIFDDYLEMVLDFGYVILFAGAMPLASAVTVVSNLLEVQSDAFKLRRVCRRPIPARASCMPHVWFRIVQAMCCAAVTTNCVFAYVCSDQMMQWLPRLFRGQHHKVTKAAVWSLFYVEHVLFVLAFIVHEALPRQPQWVSDALRRREQQRRLGLQHAQARRHSRFGLTRAGSSPVAS